MPRHAVPASLLAGLAPGLAWAALPPQHQEQREREAVVALAEALLPDGIAAIEKVGPDHYRVRSPRCRLEAHIRDLPQDGPPQPGPRRFEVEIGTRSFDP